MKYTLTWFRLRRNGTENGLSNIKDTFAESFQLQISVLHQSACLQVSSVMCIFKYVCLQVSVSSSMCVFKAGLSNLIDGWAKYKVKVLDMSDSNQNVETICNFELKFAELKDLFLKRV